MEVLERFHGFWSRNLLTTSLQQSDVMKMKSKLHHVMHHHNPSEMRKLPAFPPLRSKSLFWRQHRRLLAKGKADERSGPSLTRSMAIMWLTMFEVSPGYWRRAPLRIGQHSVSWTICHRSIERNGEKTVPHPWFEHHNNTIESVRCRPN